MVDNASDFQPVQMLQAGRAFGAHNTWFGTVMEGVLDAATTANAVRTVTDVAERVKK